MKACDACQVYEAEVRFRFGSWSAQFCRYCAKRTLEQGKAALASLPPVRRGDHGRREDSFELAP